MFTFQAFPEDCKVGDAIFHAKVLNREPFTGGKSAVNFYPPPEMDVEISDQSTEPAPAMGAFPTAWMFQRREHLILGEAAIQIWVRTS